MNPAEQVRLGRTPVVLTRLGLGTAPLGGLFRATADSEAVETVAQAYALGLRYFDTAPLYGYGLAEERLGRGLCGKDRGSFVVSTKVGRLLRADAPPDPSQYHDGEPFYKGTPPVNPVFDFSYDGVMRSLEESLGRLRLDHVDLLYIHDPDLHHQEALEGAYRALDSLRAAGTVGAIGVGMNSWEPLARFAREGNFDAFMLAGRYTLLDQSALPELLPLCAAKGIGIIAAGVYNSGILADPHTKARFNYVPAPPALVARALRLEGIARRWGVPLKAVAAQFPFSHPAVTAVVLGCRTAADVAENATLMQLAIPPGLWEELAAEGLLPAGGGRAMIIDAHHHLWDYEAGKYPWMTEAFAPIRRSFGPEHLQPVLAECGVDYTVLVQTRSSLDETRVFLELAGRTPFIAGVVGWVDLTSERVDETVTELRAGAAGAKLVGIRHQVHDEPDPEWLLRPEVQRGVAAVGRAGLAFDLLVRSRELPSAHQTVARHPTVRFVLDHLAKPPIRDGKSAEWDAWMPRLAAMPNVYCKLSGLVTEADWRGWTVAQLAPYAERVVSWFGPERLVFGSDWPVCLLAASYRDVLTAARDLLRGLSSGEREGVFGRNAVSAYDLRYLVS